MEVGQGKRRRSKNEDRVWRNREEQGESQVVGPKLAMESMRKGKVL